MIYNLDKINKIKYDKIKKCLDFVEKTNKDNIVQKIYLFGSSISNECTENSDIDLCLVTDYNSSNSVFFKIFGNIPLVMNDNCDILIYSKLKGKIKEEIDKKGVLIYKYQKI